MSTLGDLLAEHTVLPGNAVDHLHAVVGEWQLLADLSFADYLMWVRSDDEVLVCVAQVRPQHRLHGAAGRRRGHPPLPPREMPVVRGGLRLRRDRPGERCQPAPRGRSAG